jgi:sphingomyelin phosphodiesterase acid-like 3
MLARLLLCVVSLFQVLISPRAIAVEGEHSGEFLVISDIHFNPFANKELFPALAAQPVSEWGRIFESSLTDGVSQLGSDTNYVLLASCFAAAVERCPRPDFVLYAGDSLAHNWQAQYDKTASRSSDDDPGAYRDFTAKTITFLAMEFRKHFPDVPILPTLGNEDAYCGDYEVQPAGPFLAMFANAWLELPGPSLDKNAFRSSFSRGGSYSMRVPPLFTHRIIVVNSVFFSDQYENSCGSKTETPGEDAVSWLAAMLEEASRGGERVWLMMHIPVGINDYNTVKDEEAGSGPVEFWEPRYTRQFVDLLLNYRQSVQFVFSGHTHMDDFRVIGNGQLLVVVNKLVPSISPIFRNNPGFQIYEYDRMSGIVLNYHTYYLSNLSTAGTATALRNLEWKLEYDFRSAYGQKALDVAAVKSIAGELKTSASIQDIYMRFYSVSGPPAFDKAELPAYSCAILHTALEDFEKCQHIGDNASGGSKQVPASVGQ